MPDLIHLLQDQDIGFLRIVAEKWGLDHIVKDVRSGAHSMAVEMNQFELFEDIFLSLPTSNQAALTNLNSLGGIMRWKSFTDMHGPLREMGEIMRNREKPHVSPVSETEQLWYYGLIGRGFLDLNGVVQECAYLPNEFKPFIPAKSDDGKKNKLLSNQLNTFDLEKIDLAKDCFLDYACTILANLRNSYTDKLPDSVANWIPSWDDCYYLLKYCQLINPENNPIPDEAKPFLEYSRGSAMTFFFTKWKNSILYNELRIIKTFRCEGAWTNNPRRARQIVLEKINELKDSEWYSISEFLNYMHEVHPYFLRESGDFNTWLIRSTKNDGILSGDRSWLEVEGEYLYKILTQELHWLGLIDLASPQYSQVKTAFRKSAWCTNILSGLPAYNDENRADPIMISSNGLIEMSNYTPRLVRYQISRFCEWKSEYDGVYRYRLTPRSLKSALDQGLKTSQLLSLLRKHGKSSPPPSLVNAIKKWDLNGEEASIDQVVILQVSHPDILIALRKTAANKYLKKPLSPVSITVEAIGIEKVLSALARLGYLASVKGINETAKKN